MLDVATQTDLVGLLADNITGGTAANRIRSPWGLICRRDMDEAIAAYDNAPEGAPKLDTSRLDARRPWATRDSAVSMSKIIADATAEDAWRRLVGKSLKWADRCEADGRIATHMEVSEGQLAAIRDVYYALTANRLNEQTLARLRGALSLTEFNYPARKELCSALAHAHVAGSVARAACGITNYNPSGEAESIRGIVSVAEQNRNVGGEVYHGLGRVAECYERVARWLAPDQGTSWSAIGV